MARRRITMSQIVLSTRLIRTTTPCHIFDDEHQIWDNKENETKWQCQQCIRWRNPRCCTPRNGIHQVWRLTFMQPETWQLETLCFSNHNMSTLATNVAENEIYSNNNTENDNVHLSFFSLNWSNFPAVCLMLKRSTFFDGMGEISVSLPFLPKFSFESCVFSPFCHQQ